MVPTGVIVWFVLGDTNIGLTMRLSIIRRLPCTLMLGLVAAFLLIPPLFAEDKEEREKAETPKIVDELDQIGMFNDYPVSAENIVQQSAWKFNRGMINVINGWCEIPRQMVVSFQDDGPLLFIPSGLFAGVGMTLVRTMYGGFEVGTFYTPINVTYKSLLAPDYVWGPISPPPSDKHLELAN